MGMMKVIIIIGVILAGIWWFAPNQFDSGRESVFNWLSNRGEVNDNTNDDKVYNQCVTDDDCYPGEECLRGLCRFFEDPADVNTTPTNTTQEEVVVEDGQNACGYDNYGLPSYQGTINQGKTCADFIEGDNECIANPPSGYDGYINVISKFSDPKLTCCRTDGTCQW